MQSFFTSGLFWFIEGILACLTIIAFKLWMEDRGIPMPFWKWILVGAWLVGVGVTIAFVGTCLGEKEAYAATRGGMIFGTIAVIAGVVLIRLLRVGALRQGQ